MIPTEGRPCNVDIITFELRHMAPFDVVGTSRFWGGLLRTRINNGLACTWISEEYEPPLNSRLGSSGKVLIKSDDSLAHCVTMIDFEITQVVDDTTFGTIEQPTDNMSTWRMSILVQIKHS